MNICYECQHFHNAGAEGPRKDIWYNHLCKANPLEIGINPVTGKAQSVSKNDLGNTVYSYRNFAYCRNINKVGNCPDFAPKK